MNEKELDQLCINTIRILSIEAIQKAKSGHPGMPMGMAPVAYTLWSKYLKHNPVDPNWINRDRFILSAGHGSMLLYSLLHLFGYDLSLEEIKNFRQSNSKTPGHPEYGHTSGVELTTGPLGQGISSAVGMAIAATYLASYYNRPTFPIINYKVYVLVGDGCLQEGISSEASSLAGHLGLNNLIVIYDDNQITIDGNTDISFTENVQKRYESYGWFVQTIKGDGNNTQAFSQALEKAQQQKDAPSLICMQSLIGYGSPNKQGSHNVHGSPLGEDEIIETKKYLGWEEKASFMIPKLVREHCNQISLQGTASQKKWEQTFQKYKETYPKLADEFKLAQQKKLPEGWEKKIPSFQTSMATRAASGKVLNEIMPHLPMVLGGSADLTPSNNTWFEGATDFQKREPSGRYIRYGVREHAMGAILNGININGMLRAYAGTFFCFSDYMRPAIRLAALSSYPSIFVFTHDSIGVGEDGPTHQPIEHLAALRAIPNLIVFRPADANETTTAWKLALENQKQPFSIILTRQNLPVLDPDIYYNLSFAEKGAYILVPKSNPDVVLMASGSEVHLILEAAKQLEKSGISVQVVSFPSWELFESQPQTYKNKVIPKNVKVKVAVEAGISQGWEVYYGNSGDFIGMSQFGASAPGNVLYEKFEITVQNIIDRVTNLLSK